MKICPLCLLPHETPTFADLASEEAILTSQSPIASEAEAQLIRISRARFVQALRGFGYCQQCILIKGAVIGAEVGFAALSYPPSHEQIERAFLDRGEGSNVLRFPIRPRLVAAENFDGIPKRGA